MGAPRLGLSPRRPRRRAGDRRLLHAEHRRGGLRPRRRRRRVARAGRPRPGVGLSTTDRRRDRAWEHEAPLRGTLSTPRERAAFDALVLLPEWLHARTTMPVPRDPAAARAWLGTHGAQSPQRWLAGGIGLGGPGLPTPAQVLDRWASLTSDQRTWAHHLLAFFAPKGARVPRAGVRGAHSPETYLAWRAVFGGGVVPKRARIARVEFDPRSGWALDPAADGFVDVALDVPSTLRRDVAPRSPSRPSVFLGVPGTRRPTRLESGATAMRRPSTSRGAAAASSSQWTTWTTGRRAPAARGAAVEAGTVWQWTSCSCPSA